MNFGDITITCARCHKIGGMGDTYQEASKDAVDHGWPKQTRPQIVNIVDGKPTMKNVEELSRICAMCRDNE